MSTAKNKDYGKPVGPKRTMDELDEIDQQILSQAMSDASSDANLAYLLSEMNVLGLTDAQKSFAVKKYKGYKAAGLVPVISPSAKQIIDDAKLGLW